MTTTIRVWFNGMDSDDCLRCRRLNGRLDDFKRVMAKSARPWEIMESGTFDDVGNQNGYQYVFHINEFYEGIVKDLLMFLDDGNMGWYDWFREKYGTKSA